MEDRVPTPGQEGRVLITPENGSAPFYATVAMADNPTQAGTPYNKEAVLQDDTAALFNLDNTAAPDDVFQALATLVPNDYAVILLVVTDANGNPAATSINVSPAISGESSIATNANGRISVSAPPGTYTFTIPDTALSTGSTTTVSVGLQDLVIAKLTLSIQEHGKLYCDTSRNITFPNAFPPVDIFAVSGGGSGAKCGDFATDCASGGGGGFTKTILAQNVSAKTLEIIIGAGGVQSPSINSDQSGVDGGRTIVTLDGAQIINLAGGKGGNVGSSFYSYAIGGNGGSGGGGANSTSISGGKVGDGGSDGSNGTNDRGGTGQGTSTKEFGEQDGVLYCGGGGGANAWYAGNGGEGGGGAGIRLSGGTGGNATNYGGGGGAYYVNSSGASGKGGDGYQGLVVLRW